MAELMFHEKSTAAPNAALSAKIMDQAELDVLLEEAYAKGRSDAFTFLGLDESDFPEGDGARGWTV